MEDQQKFVVPLNRETEKIFYTENGSNLRLIIDAKVLTEPRAYIVSKVNRLSPNGLVRITLAEKLFNPHTDYIEKDDNGNVIGMWADYWKDSNIPPKEPEPLPVNIYSTITYSGTKPELKIGGSYKKFTVTFYKDDEPTIFQYGNWKFTIDNKDASDLLEISTSGLEENQIKVKFHGNDSYTGKVLTVIYESFSGVKSSVEMNLIGI